MNQWFTNNIPSASAATKAEVRQNRTSRPNSRNTPCPEHPQTAHWFSYLDRQIPNVLNPWSPSLALLNTPIASYPAQSSPLQGAECPLGPKELRTDGDQSKIKNVSGIVVGGKTTDLPIQICAFGRSATPKRSECTHGGRIHDQVLDESVGRAYQQAIIVDSARKRTRRNRKGAGICL